MGTITEPIASVEKNKIRYALIDLTREIEEISSIYPEIDQNLSSIKKDYSININQKHSGSGDNIAGDKTMNM